MKETYGMTQNKMAQPGSEDIIKGGSSCEEFKVEREERKKVRISFQ
jgi:hypothetical protein